MQSVQKRQQMDIHGNTLKTSSGVAVAVASVYLSIGMQAVMVFLNQLAASLAARKQTDLGYPMCNVPRSPKPSYISMIWSDRAVAAWTRANDDTRAQLSVYTSYIYKYPCCRYVQIRATIYRRIYYRIFVVCFVFLEVVGVSIGLRDDLILAYLVTFIIRAL